MDLMDRNCFSLCIFFMLLLPNICSGFFISGHAHMISTGRLNFQVLGKPGCAGREKLYMANDFQENTIGVSPGDRVKVLKMEQKFYHIIGFRDDGLDATGLEGIVKELKLTDKKTGIQITANRPVVVAFAEPHKFIAHFEFAELEKLE